MSKRVMPRFNRYVVALVALVAAAAVGGCGGGSSSSSGATGEDPQAGGTLRLSQGEEVIVLDALESLDTSSINVISQINEPLFKLNAENEIEPWLVTQTQKSPDQRVWTLSLRPGVKFSTGDPMTSRDVLFTLEQARKSTYWEELFSGVQKIEAPSPSTVVIKNRKPSPELEVLLSQWSFGVVPDGYGGKTYKEFQQEPIGTGPFMLGAWKHGESVTLTKNPLYWEEGRPYLDKVVFQTVNSADSRVAQLKGGQLDAIYSPPWPQLKALESNPDVTVGEFPLGYSWYLKLNSRTPLFENQKVREAAEFAIDRESLVEAVLQGHGEEAGTWIPAAVPYSDQSIKPVAQDIPKAKQLLSEAVSEGVKPSFSLLTLDDSTYWETAAQIVQQNLEEVGFSVTLEPGDFASTQELQAAGDYEASTGEIYASTPSPSELYTYFNTTEGINTGVDTTETTRLAEEAVSALEPQEREAIWSRVQQLTTDERFILPLTYSPFAWAMNSKVVGFSVTLTGIPWLGDTGLTG